MEQKPDGSSENAAENLDNLLDSCLDDFNKPIPAKVFSEKSDAKSSKTQSKPAGISTPLDSASWSEEFKEFNEVLQNCFTSEADLEAVSKLMEGCFPGEGLPPADDESFMKSFASSIQQLTQQAQNVPDPSADDISNLLGSLGMDDSSIPDAEGMSEIMPLMQSVMQKLMSKDMLYPSIKEIVEKYPAWLDENRSSLDATVLGKYEQQLALMKEICAEFERQLDSSEAAQKDQFQKVLELMQKVQTFGNPPKELVSNVGPGIPLDDQGNPQIPGLSDQCAIM